MPITPTTDTVRSNIGIVLCHKQEQVLWAERQDQPHAWQFPQGGVHAGESLEAALWRELAEELGLMPTDVQILGQTRDWLTYTYAKPIVKEGKLITGQRQHWFALALTTDPQKINLNYSAAPEFVRWRWSSYWYPIYAVVPFKQAVYRAALTQLAPFVLKQGSQFIGDA